MTRDEIIKLAQDAGFYCYNGCVEGIDADLGRFAALVAAAERKACAQLCEAQMTGVNPVGDIVREDCAAAIRARGEK